MSVSNEEMKALLDEALKDFSEEARIKLSEEEIKKEVQGFLDRKKLLEKAPAIQNYFSEALSDVVLFDGEEVQTIHITILGELAKAYAALVSNKSEFKTRDNENAVFKRNEIPSFIHKHREIMQHLTVQLMKLNEHDLYDIMNNLGKALYDTQWNPVPAAPKNEENTTRILYRAKNGELAIRFPNKETRDAFHKEFQPTKIPENYRRDNIQYALNKEGVVPCIYEDQDNHLYFPSYRGQGEEFAINCGTAKNRELLIKLLKIKESDRIHYAGYETIVYADGFFTVYTDTQHSNAIYFNPISELFTKPGTFLKIDTVTGTLEQCKIKDYNAQIVIEPNSRFSEQPVYPLIKPQPKLVSDGIAFHAAPQQPMPQPSIATLRVQTNQAHAPELVIQFSEQACSANWYAQITGLAQLLGVDSTDLIVQEGNTITIKASSGVGHFGVYQSKPQTNGHFQFPPQLAVNFVDSQLRDYFFSSLNFKKEDKEILTLTNQELRGNAVYFNPEKLPPQGNKTLQKLINEIYMADCDAFIINDNAAPSFK